LKTLWHIISKILFWDYERGSAPYDLMVLGVVVFVFLTPRAWFNDRPTVSSEMHGEQLRLLGEDTAARTRTYRIDAHLLAPSHPGQQWERRAHDLLEKNVPEFRHKKFSIVRFEPRMAPDGTVLYYDVVVR
jgi:hypothetical protein